VKSLTNKQQAVFFVALSAACSSVATVFKVAAVSVIHPLHAAVMGVLFAALVLFIVVRVKGEKISLTALVPIWKPLLALVILRPILGNILFTFGMAYSTGIKAMMLTKMEPYVVLLWVWLLDGKSPKSSDVTLLLLHIFGAVLLSVGADLHFGSAQIGDVLIGCAVLFAALSYRYVPQVTSKLGAIQTNAWVELFGGLLIAPFIFLFLPLTIAPHQYQGWYYMAAHVLLFNVIALSLWYASLKNLEHWLSSALRALGPIVAAPFAWFFFDERIDAIQAVGGALVLATSVLLVRANRSKA
jgi:drug/metabolite transporter (DMT)-like permease